MNVNEMNQLGDKIEDYDRLNLLGKGSFAEVYRARCRFTKMYVAIKMIDKHLMKSKGMTDRVKQEANIQLNLNHPAILQLYRFFEDTNYIYLILELAEYGDIQNYLRTNNIQLTETETAVIMKQIVDGLLYLHSHKIVHRDMKLPNLLVTGEMRVKIADFGLATQLKTSTEKHMTMCGTPNYMPPEVASRISHGLPADVWSLGIMMYTLLVGRPPFDTDAVALTLQKVITSELMIPIDMSYEAKDLLGRLLQKDQTLRIRLDEIMHHPFMSKHNQTIASTDSGLHTMSSSNRSAQPYRYNLQEEAIHEATESPGYGRAESGYVDSYGEFVPVLRRFGSLDVGRTRQQDNSYHGSGSAGGARVQSHYSDNVMDKNNRPNDPGGGELLRFNRENIMVNQQFTSTNSIIFPNAIHRDEPKLEKFNMAPINAERLLPTRYKTKKVILTIDILGNVIVELIRFKAKYNADRIVDICRISKDGQRIEVYQPDSGRGIEIKDSAPIFPASATMCFAYDMLPSQHWKKYTYASRFVQLVRAKTAKLTFYSTQAKCLLMETLEDFEMVFYDGCEKFLRTPAIGIQFIDRHGNASNVPVTYRPETDVGPPAMLWQHYQHCFAHCMALEKALRLMPMNDEVFPNIVGRRPVSAPSYESGGSSAEQIPNVMMTPSTPNMLSLTSSVNSISSNRRRTTSTPIGAPSRRVFVPGIGTAIKSSQGVLEVQYLDGTQLTVLPKADQGGGFCFRNSIDKIPMRFTSNDVLPTDVRRRLEEFPIVLDCMAASETSQTPMQPRPVNAMRFCR